jgi:hypothetical protein
MLKRMSLVAGAVVVALAAAALLGGTVFAGGPGPKAGYGDEIGGRDIPLAVAADLTGLTEEQLLAELEGGKTIPALLEEMGIDLATFHQAVADARQAAVQEAADSGSITSEQAQAMLQRMQERQAQGATGPQGQQAGTRQMLRDGNCDGAGPSGPMGSASYGEPGEGTGPGLSRHYGAAWR